MADPRPAIAYEQDEEGIVTLTFDKPNGSVNIIDPEFEADLELVVARLVRNVDQITGVILASAKHTFLAGGDLNRLAAFSEERSAAQVAEMDSLKQRLRVLETLGRPVVAAINGSALGGRLELALATHYRIAVDAERSRIGLPEVGFGLLPGGGGLTRTVRMFGLRKALFQIVLPGTRFTVTRAYELGLVDEVVSSVEQLRPRAVAWIRENPRPVKPWDTPWFRLPGGVSEVAELLEDLPQALKGSVVHPRFPAPTASIVAAVAGAKVGFDTALHSESEHLVQLANGQITKNMIHAVFFDSSAVSRGVQRPLTIWRHPLSRATLAGSGRSLRSVSRLLRQAGVSVAEGTSMLGDAQIVLTEQRLPEAQRAASAISLVAFQLRPGLPDGANDFAQILLVAPLEKSGLMQIVPGPGAHDRTLGLAYDLAAALGKQAILTESSPKSFVERLVACLVEEATSLRGEGFTRESLRVLARAVGFSTESESWLPEPDIAGASEAAHSLSRHTAEDAEDRLLFAAAVAVLRALDEGNIGSSAEANIASFLAVGFPAWTGGAARFAEQYAGGVPGFLRRAQSLEQRHGKRFSVDRSILGC